MTTFQDLARRVQEYIEPQNTVISLGCGIGNIERYLNCKLMVGVDIWKPYMIRIKDFAVPVCYDIRKIKDLFVDRTFDVVVCSDAIEHLEKEEGLKLIDDAESLAIKNTIFYTPVNWTDNDQDDDSWAAGNPHQNHKTLWNEKDFKDKGYEVYLDYPTSVNPFGILARKRVV